MSAHQCLLSDLRPFSQQMKVFQMISHTMIFSKGQEWFLKMLTSTKIYTGTSISGVDNCHIAPRIDWTITDFVNFICGNKMPTRCNRGFYCRSYCLLNMFRAPLCPSSGAQEHYTVVAACGISCCGFQVAGLVWS